ncbi:unnamed protein product [Kuraishia capsulata CBS 1993]|uniref:Uncharacterized protein n=1 Tax=Kuraishia capsulata CBS 1993 TaxID=1382522 RepID=W6MXN3_9ASCO|nr:uncharacterized protein KUCA_T00005177001 [Kuraishia capsulata CBS 1993]CDK29190.1 unnamed protein product [Kuraishia capsulata CBS 1993]
MPMTNRSRLNITGSTDESGYGSSVLKFLHFGEGLYNSLLSFAKTSSYFKRPSLRTRGDIKDRVRNDVGDLIDRV